MPYLNCPSCGFAVSSASVFTTSRDCPRCERRQGESVRMFISVRPQRLLGPESLPAGGQAPPSPRLSR